MTTGNVIQMSSLADVDAERVIAAQAGLVVDTDQSPGDGYLGHGPILTFRPWTDHPSRTSRPTVSTSSARSATSTSCTRAARPNSS